MKNFDPIGFKNDLTQMPLNNVLLFKDPNEALNFWCLMFTHVLDRHAPKTKKRVKSWQRPEWITTEILEAIKLRQFYTKKKRLAEHKIQRHIVKKVVNKAKCDYYETLVKNGKNKSASIWKCIVSLSNKKSSNSPSTMHIGGNTLGTVHKFQWGGGGGRIWGGRRFLMNAYRGGHSLFRQSMGGGGS